MNTQSSSNMSSHQSVVVTVVSDRNTQQACADINKTNTERANILLRDVGFETNQDSF